MGRRVACVAIAIAVAGCGKDLASAPLPDLEQAEVGERCASRHDLCTEDGNVLECSDGYWTLEDCAARCDDAEWFGCLFVDALAFCECGERVDPSPPLPPPIPPLRGCLDAQTLQFCDHEGECVAYDCQVVCADASRSSAGCFETAEGSDCHCTSAGIACDEGTPPRCDGATALASCIDGAWSIAPCALECPDGTQTACRLAEDGTSACVCTEP